MAPLSYSQPAGGETATLLKCFNRGDVGRDDVVFSSGARQPILDEVLALLLESDLDLSKSGRRQQRFNVVD